MSSPDISFGAGDTTPTIARKLLDEDGNPIDLSGVGTSVAIRYRDKDQLTSEVTEAVAIAQTADVATIGDVIWTPGGARVAGDYNTNWIVTTAGGPRTVPPGRYLWMQVQPAP